MDILKKWVYHARGVANEMDERWIWLVGRLFLSKDWQRFPCQGPQSYGSEAAEGVSTEYIPVLFRLHQHILLLTKLCCFHVVTFIKKKFRYSSWSNLARMVFQLMSQWTRKLRLAIHHFTKRSRQNLYKELQDVGIKTNRCGHCWPNSSPVHKHQTFLCLQLGMVLCWLTRSRAFTNASWTFVGSSWL